MSSSKIYHNVTRLPIVSTIVLIWGNYEIYRIHKGTHPYWSPKLEAAGMTRKKSDSNAKSIEQVEKAADASPKSTDNGGVSAVSIRWQNLNGVPIPTLEALLRPAGKE